MDLAEARSRLRAAPLREFVRVRRELATELRAAGEAHLAKLVASRKKPNRAEWALAQVDEDRMRELEHARAAARKAQEHASGDALREAFAEYRRAVTAVLDEAVAIARENKMTITAAQEREMRAALERPSNDPLEALPKSRPKPKRRAAPASRARDRAREKLEKRAQRELAKNEARAERAAADVAVARAKLEALRYRGAR